MFTSQHDYPSGSSCIGIDSSLQAHLVLEESQTPGSVPSSYNFSTVSFNHSTEDNLNLCMHLPVGLAVVLDADAHRGGLSKRMQQSWKELSPLNQQNFYSSLFGSFLT